MHLVEYKDFIHAPLDIIRLRQGGLYWHGGMAGGMLAIYIFAKKRGLSFGGVADYITPLVAIALAVGRIGCFLNGCCYGKVCSLPWAVVFADAGIQGARHPAQLYELILNVILFFILLYWWKRKSFDGEIAIGFFMIYSAIRAFCEIFRDSKFVHWGMSLAQLTSILGFFVFLGLLLYFRRKYASQK